MQRDEKSQKTRDQLLRAATDEFAAGGYVYASMRRICHEAGATNGKMFHHFKNKEELYLACVETNYTQLANCMCRFELDIKRDLLGNLDLLHALWQSFWHEHPDLIPFFQNVRVSTPPELIKQTIALRRRTFTVPLKNALREITTFFYPNDPKRQAMLSAVWMTLLDYTAVGVGIQKLDLYNNMHDWLASQEKVFHQMLRSFLFGFDSPKLTEYDDNSIN